MQCNHRALKMLEELQGKPLLEIDVDGISAMDDILYCAILKDARAQHAALNREAFENALDSMTGLEYARATRAAMECYTEAFKALDEEGKESGEPGGDPLDGAGTRR